MYRTGKKFLWVSFISVIIFCMVIFAWIYKYLGDKSEETVTEIGKIYMSEMNRQIEQKFTTVIELRMSQVEGILMRTPPESVTYNEQMLEEMELNASVRNVTYLGLYRRNGENEMLYGEPVQLDNTEEHQCFLDGELQVTSCFDEDGNHVVILGAEAAYPMKDGGKSDLLVVGFLMDNLEASLVEQREDSMLYTYLLQQGGDFVVRGEYARRGNYLEYLMESIQEFNGKPPEQQVQEIGTALDSRQEYSTLILANDGRRHLYCTPLPDTSWSLVSVMPYHVLDEMINSQSSQRIGMILGACGAEIGRAHV